MADVRDRVLVRFAPDAYSEWVTRIYFLILAVTVGLFSGVPRRAIVGGAPIAANTVAVDGDTVVSARHFTREHPADYLDGSVNAVIEIPTGTTAKFEVDEVDGALRWARDREHGRRREIDYLPFIVNYGSVPRTLAPDGDPIDIVVLSRTMERGQIARTRVIGVLQMVEHDGVTRDDKLIAVPLDPEWWNGFSRLRNLDELDARYADVRVILWTWFASYWGRGRTNVVGWGDVAEAQAALDAAKEAFSVGRSSLPASRRSLAASALRLEVLRPFGVHVH